MKTYTCYLCGVKFTPSKYKPNAKFCSGYCRIHGAGKLSAEARGNAQRGRGKGKSYTKLMGRHEHRVVAEKTLGRPLRKEEVVHHIDGNHKNNSPENLVVITRSEHATIHGTKNRVCVLKNCGLKHYAKDLCEKHYSRKRHAKIANVKGVASRGEK